MGLRGVYLACVSQEREGGRAARRSEADFRKQRSRIHVLEGRDLEVAKYRPIFFY